MYDNYLFPLPRATKWNRPIFDHSEVKIDLYAHVCVCFGVGAVIITSTIASAAWKIITQYLAHALLLCSNGYSVNPIRAFTMINMINDVVHSVIKVN